MAAKKKRTTKKDTTTTLSQETQSPIREQDTGKRSPNTNKWLIPLIAIALILALLYYAKGYLIAATVNGKPIARWSVVSALEKRGGKATLDGIVTEMLIQQEAEKRKVTLSEKELDEQVKKIENTVKAQGQDINTLLQAQGMTKDDLRKQIRIQKQLEKMLGQSAQVTDAEVSEFMESNQATLPEGTDSEELKKQVREQIKQQKINQKAQEFIAQLKAQAKIVHFVEY